MNFINSKENEQLIELLKSMKIKLEALDDETDANDLLSDIDFILGFIQNNNQKKQIYNEGSAKNVISKIILLIKLFTHCDDIDE